MLTHEMEYWIGTCDRECSTVCDCDKTVNVTSECYTHDGTDYRGRQNVTIDGVGCVNWNYLGMSGPGLVGHAYCRNPDGKQSPWCFTNVRTREWGYCHIDTPPSDMPCTEHTALSAMGCAPRCTAAMLLNDQCDDECNVAACNFDMNRCTDTECFTDARGNDYRGTMYKTISGLTCQNWRTTYPHFHSYDVNYNHKGVGNHNFCRNPDNYSSPWCFTSDFTRRWEACSQLGVFQKDVCTNHSETHCKRECANGLGDGICDSRCDVYECLWDGGDCADIILKLGDRFQFDTTRMHVYSQNAKRYASEYSIHIGSIVFGACVCAILINLVKIATTRRREMHRRAMIRRGEADPAASVNTD